MKRLILLNDSTTFKVNDTGTLIKFEAENEKQPVFISDGQSAVFRIKNDLGFLKSVDATTSVEGYVFQLNTSNLSSLVPGTYSVELAISKDGEQTIFPDEGFVQIEITKNAYEVTGEQLATISLDDFKKQLKTYVDNETDALKSNFENYVADIKTGPQGPAGADGTNGKDGAQGAQGKAATISIGTVSTLEDGQSAYVNNTGSNTDAVLNYGIPKGQKGDTGEKGEKGDTGDVTAYCNSTGWLQTGIQWDSNATNKRAQYKVDTINGSSLMYFFCSVCFPKTYLSAWGKTIFTFPNNIAVNTTTNIFINAVTAYGTCNLKIRNNQLILNQYNDIGNADSSGNIELNFWGYVPVTLSY